MSLMRRDIFSVQKDVINQRIELKNLPFWNNVAMGLHRYALKTVDSKNLLIHPLRLKGGGESSISNGTSAWGKVTTNTSQPTSSDNGVWGQMGSNSETNNSVPPSSQQCGSPNNTPNNNGSGSSTKQQLEQLQSLREAIFSQDGWGVQFVNQSTNWDIPSSPEPPNKVEGTNGSVPWKPPVNNGTELWEVNLRNGGQPPQKTAWGHTPANNIGGTWGEDDEADSSNVWTGGNSNQQHWSANGNTNNGAIWNGSKKEDDWVANKNNNNNQNDPRVPDPRQLGADAREVCSGNRDATNTDSIRLLEHRELMRQMPNDMRGDPRGITGRLNGSVAETFWGQSTHISAQSTPHHKLSNSNNGTTAWNESTTISQNRISPNHDDGTSLWGTSQQGSQWKDLPTPGMVGRNSAPTGNFNMTQTRMKPESWANGRSGGWDEIANQGAAWDEQAMWTKPKVSNNLWENEQEWSQKSNKLHLTKEIIWSSKQFRMLVDMGHKKEDVENALRLREMNLDEAVELLNTLRRPDNWGNRHDDHYDTLALGNQKYSLGPNVPLNSFPPSNSDSNIINGLSNSININNTLLNNMSSPLVQKMLLQEMVPQGLTTNQGLTANRNLQSQPSSHQLKILVGQIQMAVQAGFLNNQILNQPLAPQTLALLNQLLQQIKTLQQLIAQQSVVSTYPGKGNSAYMQYSLLITKTRNAITNIQSQINTQQNNYLKQQMTDVLKPNMIHDSINALQNNFIDLGINKEPATQSKLNQWIKKDKDGSEFSRAPGSKSKLSASTPLGMTSNEGPWSTRRNGELNWPNANDELANGNDSPWSTLSQSSVTDLVPEFEPGKPWKGNQIKSIEDDPSITPGSVVRSTLSIPTIKDSWTNNPQSSATNTYLSAGKFPTANNDLSDSNAAGLDLWTVPKHSNKGFPSDNWSNPMHNSASWGTHQQNSGNWTGSTWLLLRNLTAQIDGCTLRTLCMQHGPLVSFNLNLYQGFALAKYPSREKASKAQITLNNCVLGNTTILAENPSDWDANVLLQQLANPQNGSSGNWRGTANNKANTTDSWNSSWPTHSSSNPWPVGVDCNDMRGTPSNLNSFLPNDLLGESI